MTSALSGSIGVFGRLTLRTGRSAREIRPHVHGELSVLAHDGGTPLHMSVGAGHQMLRAGQAMFINPWQFHAPLRNEEGPRRLLTFFLEQQWLDSLQRGPGLERTPAALSNTPLAMDDASVTLLRDIGAASLDVGTASGAVLEARIAALVQALLLASSRRSQDGARGELQAIEAGAMRHSVDVRIRRIVAHLVAHPTEPFDADRLARSAGLSRSQLFKLFKSEMGCPPRYFADAARVRYAIAALGDPTVQIADIADSLGFSAPGHFTTFFSQHMGVAPGVYRRHLLHLAD